MPFEPGACVGAYEIVALVGAGGMGQVYRARDTRLGRDVALKTLPAGFVHDAERVARFRREAHVLAMMNHPNIAGIHGVEEAEGSQFLALEFVDGETLASRIEREPIPLTDALSIAKQIAAALEAAHAKDIIHRDLKPANIALTGDDEVKVLDFGLARSIDPSSSSDAAHSPTLTFAATQAGVILGTAAYMSPEQAKGRPTDKRTDVWGFGCVLYEMLARKRAFDGDDVSEAVAAVLRGEPDWDALPPALPSQIRTLLQRCLAKDRQQRIGDMAVVRYVLGDTAVGATPIRARSNAWTRAAQVGGALALAGLATAGGWMLRTPAESLRRLARFSVALPSDQIISEVVRRRHLVALSPDGSQLAYIANDQIYLRPMDGLDAAPIRGSREQPLDLTFSPDGQWIAYQSGSRLKKIPVNGGAPVTLAEVPPTSGISWSGDRILFGAGARGILEVPATGGTATTLIPPASDGRLLYGPQLLSDGNRVLFTVLDPSSVTELSSTAEIVVQALDSGARTTLLRGGLDGRYVASGHLIFARDGVLFANAADIDRLALKGGATGIIDGVAVAMSLPGGAMQAAVAGDGTLVYLPATRGAVTTLAWRSRQGNEIILPAPPHAYDQPRVSPDGRRVAVHVSDGDNDLWIWESTTETLTRLTFERGLDSFPAWTTDGKRIVYVSAAGGGTNLFIRAADGTGQPEPLLAKPPESSGALVANGMTPDGRFLIYSVGVPSNIMKLPLDGSREPQPVLNNPQYAERSGQVSPDARWIAYQSDESSTFQVYVRPFPNVDGGRWQVSAEGGSVPIWHPSGRELFYIDPANRIMSVPIAAAATFSFGKPVLALDFSDRPASVYRNYDIAPDGSRFILAKESQRGRGASQFIVVLNWLEELKQRVPRAP
jgi:eukaryotic-like serine/threonine-protein kinase